MKSECAILSQGLGNPSHEEDIREAQFLIGAGWGMSFPRSMQEYKEFLFWVRSSGSKAWIVEPNSIREKERAEVRRMMKKYES